MSISSEIDRINANVANTYSALEGAGADMPSQQNTDNLPETVLTIKAVRYDAQTLTDAQKEQARENIGVGEGYRAELVQAVLESIGCPLYGIIGENNIITVTSQLPDGVYTLVCENEDGTTAEVGTITIGSGVVEIINLLETALTPNDITTVFDGKGYKNGYYASAATPYYNTDAAFFCTGLMPIPDGRTFYIKGCTFDTSLSHTRFGAMSETGLLVNTATLANWGNHNIIVTELGAQYYSITLADSFMSIAGTNGGSPYYFYFSASGTGEGVIVSATPIE